MDFETIKSAFVSALGGFNILDGGHSLACFGPGGSVWVLRAEGSGYALSA